MELTTCLTIVKNSNHLLMIEKKRGLGKGYITFPGGKVEVETPDVCTVRELKEEVGITGYSPRNVARIIFVQKSGKVNVMYVYQITNFSGHMVETEEAKPFWIDKNKLPFEKMWIDDRFWLPKVLGGKYVDCIFMFSDNWENLLEGNCYEIMQGLS
ncbi:8-oxo-dGTP diphosphatase [Acidianus sp. RZ1]|uniref:8-oxo-dGTP diphosphatase n=1 Tax=Acidianus sp. RZ1 TaxID=1540082 RepID=UPI001490DE5B|nr:8-oxo-dGTP diphosphatase [Acidianus sp. RZ1]NON63550.1 8-oxo-dGTP diphosphatase [Acidianus sp. RZ1]